MAKKVDVTVLDALLDAADAAVELYICEGEPTDRADAIARALHSAAVTRTPVASNQNGAAGSREYTDGPFNNVTLDNITATQTPDHVAITSASVLLLVTTITGSTPLSNNTVVDLNTWIHNVAAPV